MTTTSVRSMLRRRYVPKARTPWDETCLPDRTARRAMSKRKYSYSVILPICLRSPTKRPRETSCTNCPQVNTALCTAPRRHRNSPIRSTCRGLLAEMAALPRITDRVPDSSRNCGTAVHCTRMSPAAVPQRVPVTMTGTTGPKTSRWNDTHNYCK